MASVARVETRRRRFYEPGDPYADGFDAALSAGGTEDKNPYRTGTDSYSLWVAGFRYAMNADEDE